ncbi:MAG: NAD-dependent epimerase/dehydratase family protein [Deltaproteobacteria bacterium]|jgi:uncharacterized protein YbjT (DUF2867 family)|nr:NAD-dependent epimerase/dehydratase family protein [Deltaproteobacteria bacterium]
MDNPLRVLIFGASGMVGAAVLDTCLDDPRVTSVLVVGRSPVGRTHEKLTEIQHADLFDLVPISSHFTDVDACFFTAGVSAAGMKEADYTRVTYDLTLAVAKVLVVVNPAMAFLYVSGAGTDETEKGRSMWARVKGRTENALLALGFRRAVMVRLAGLIPLKGTRSKVALYRWSYRLAWPVLPLVSKLAPSLVTTPKKLGRAMIAAALGEGPVHMNPKDIERLGRS